MPRSVSESRVIRDSHAGHSSGAAIPTPELIALNVVDIRRRFLSLENAHQRSGFLDAIVAKLGGNLGDWARFYEAVEIVREQDDYWKSKGYASFEEFWHAVAGPSFRSFKELEDVYNFAKTACPELFHIDFDGAKQLRKRLSALIGRSGNGTIAGARSKKRLYEDASEAHAALSDAMKWHNAGGTSLEYRLAKLRRDRPDIAARILAGEYFKYLRTGQIGIDMAAAERDAYGDKFRRRRRALPVGERVCRLIRESARSSSTREDILSALSKIGWLVNGLSTKSRK